MQLSDLLDAARLSVSAPREGFRRMSGLGLSRNELLMALVAVSLIGLLVGEVIGWVMAARGQHAMLDFGGPFRNAVIQLMTGMLLAIAIERIGRLFGGRGSFEDALLAVVWMQFILFLLTVLQLGAALLLPPLAALLGLAGMMLLIWLASGFIAELHGFGSQGKTALGMILSLFALSFAVLIVLLFLGIDLQEFVDA